MFERLERFITTDIGRLASVHKWLLSQLLCSFSGSADSVSECLIWLPFLTSSCPLSVLTSYDLIDPSFAASSFEIVPRISNLPMIGSCRRTLSPELNVSLLECPLLFATENWYLIHFLIILAIQHSLSNKFGKSPCVPLTNKNERGLALAPGLILLFNL